MTVRAVVVGSLVMDLSFAVPRRPEAGDVVVATRFGQYRGGKGYDQAVALARLGVDVTFIGAVGQDDFGRQFLAALDAEGVDATRMVVTRDAPTSVAVPMVTPDGDVAFVHSPGANHHLLPNAVEHLPACDVLLLQGEVPIATSIAAARQARSADATVMLNPAPVHAITPELLSVADFLTPNEIEAHGLAPNTLDPAAMTDALAAGRRGAIITLGARGAVWSIDGERGSTQPPAVRAVDATGAGDAFCAALAVALIEGQSAADAVRFACAAGAAAATVHGAEPGLPTRQAVERLASR